MRTGTLIISAIAAFGISQAHAEDTASGEKIYKSLCTNCHGPTAKGMASFPALAGRDSAYLTMRLEQYRAGEMVGPNSPLMYPIAGNLSDGDIASIATFITTTFD